LIRQGVNRSAARTDGSDSHVIDPAWGVIERARGSLLEDDFIQFRDVIMDKFIQKSKQESFPASSPCPSCSCTESLYARKVFKSAILPCRQAGGHHRKRQRAVPQHPELPPPASDPPATTSRATVGTSRTNSTAEPYGLVRAPRMPFLSGRAPSRGFNEQTKR
jgi:hypothetical protein